MPKKETLKVTSTETSGSGNFVYRITLPRSFVESNRKIIGREFRPTMSFTGNIVLKRA